MSKKELLTSGILIFLSLFHIYTAGFGQFGVMVQRGVPLLGACIAIFLIFPLGAKRGQKYPNPYFAWVDGLLILGTIFSVGYVVIFYTEIANRMGITKPVDIYAGVVGADLPYRSDTENNG